MSDIVASLGGAYQDVAVLIGVVGIAYGLMVKIRKDTQKENEVTRQLLSAKVTQANGTPIAMIESSPLPEWAKGIDGRMKIINWAYEQVFNVRRHEYIGRLDVEVWPREVAMRFAEHDATVLQERRLVEFVEEVPVDRANPHGKVRRLLVQKYPIYNTGRTEIIAIGGRCLDAEALSSILLRGRNAGLEVSPESTSGGSD